MNGASSKGAAKLKKLEIFTTSGFVITVNDTFEEIMAILDGTAIGPDEHIFLRLENGHRLTCRKKDIVGIAEYEE
ncbi:MAG: hypothetical protein RR225_10220 [Clostridium sp.]